MKPPVFDLAGVGRRGEPARHTYGWRDSVLYALSVGAKRDEMPFLYERLGPRTVPTYAIAPAINPVFALLDTVCGGGGPRMLTRLAMDFRAPVPPEGTLVVDTVVRGIYDHPAAPGPKGPPAFATVVITSETKTEAGAVLCDAEWTCRFPTGGGFGGPEAPKRENRKPPERAPDWSHEDPSSPEQAFFYRVTTGDLNPMHIDTEVANQKGWEKVLLHGTCSMAYIARAAIRLLCDGDPARLTSLAGDFRRPAQSGDLFKIDGWKADGGRYDVALAAKDRNELLISNASVVVAPAGAGGKA